MMTAPSLIVKWSIDFWDTINQMRYLLWCYEGKLRKVVEHIRCLDRFTGGLGWVASSVSIVNLYVKYLFINNICIL